MKANNSVHTLESNLPTHCAGRLHELEWVVEGSIAVCVGGHEGVVWVMGEHGRLRCEINPTMRALAGLVMDLRKNVRVETKTVYVEVPAPRHLTYKREHSSFTHKPATREELIEWSALYRQRVVAEKIGISRGLLCDIISGRRVLTMSVALMAGEAMKDVRTSATY